MAEDLRYPGIRMEGVSFHRAQLSERFYVRAPLEPFGLAYLLRRGSLIIEVDSTPSAEHVLNEGDVVSMSGLIRHRFRTNNVKRTAPKSNLETVPWQPQSEPKAPELIVGKVPNESLLVAGVYAGALVITSDQYPLINRRIWKAFELIEDELNNADALGWTADSVRQLSEIMLLNMMRAGIEGAMRGHLNARALLDMRLLRALMAMGRDPFRTWTVAELARAAGMSRTAFAVHFREVLNDSPLQMLRLLRLQAASMELSNSVQGIEEVANKCGYGSAAAFIRAFRRNFGMTPSRWRTQHRRQF